MLVQKPSTMMSCSIAVKGPVKFKEHSCGRGVSSFFKYVQTERSLFLTHKNRGFLGAAAIIIP